MSFLDVEYRSIFVIVCLWGAFCCYSRLGFIETVSGACYRDGYIVPALRWPLWVPNAGSRVFCFVFFYLVTCFFFCNLYMSQPRLRPSLNKTAKQQTNKHCLVVFSYVFFGPTL